MSCVGRGEGARVAASQIWSMFVEESRGDSNSV